MIFFVFFLTIPNGFLFRKHNATVGFRTRWAVTGYNYRVIKPL